MVPSSPDSFRKRRQWIRMVSKFFVLTTSITKCYKITYFFGSFWKIYYKVWQTEVSRISKQWLWSVRNSYCKVWEVLKSVTIIKKWDVTSFWYKLIQSQLQETSNSLTIYHEIYDRQINIIFYSMLRLRVEGWGVLGQDGKQLVI